jgi:hypothetical protein
LFAKSEGRYFRSFAMCREKWINHLNPNVKKTDWSLEEDVELFTMIQAYGCRWALISRELKGIRSEHSVKNRYHVLCKTIKRQYRLGDTHQLNEKILKYLNVKLEKQQESQEEMNSSAFSLDSKCSRERSREEEKAKLNRSQESEEEEAPFNVFNEIYRLEPENTESFTSAPQTNHEFALKDYYNDLKEEKKTNDREEDEDEEPQKLKAILDFDGQESSEVRPNTIEELDREYNRLLNFSDDSDDLYLPDPFNPQG